jgi:hypothetical protein
MKCETANAVLRHVFYINDHIDWIRNLDTAVLGSSGTLQKFSSNLSI